MKTSEFRTGNNAYLKLDTIKDTVVIIIATDIMMLDEGKDHLLPIPLTEEWLTKFGFEKLTDRAYDRFLKQEKEFSMCIEWTVSGSYKLDYYLTEIRHVHQLQNLYFALTGEELTIQSTIPPLNPNAPI